MLQCYKLFFCSLETNFFRSEMHIPSVSVKFGLIIRAYLAGASDHIPILSKQIHALNVLKAINTSVKDPVGVGC